MPDTVFTGSNEAATKETGLMPLIILEESLCEISGNLEELDGEKITVGRGERLR